ncbi:hypothetical protein L873DRAFT_1239802 [Choiromyces venosus 120613-1]|uniref:Uncharacterized protein n=1 Tax=Choiromyces venosus 120613-1 TaxID=1336337 RepID=A0A3N4JDS1_9PEZI|nr:hypothetical protein L873DRAFT_1239802 [Choiromyces venosus 120613-1]
MDLDRKPTKNPFCFFHSYTCCLTVFFGLLVFIDVDDCDSQQQSLRADNPSYSVRNLAGYSTLHAFHHTTVTTENLTLRTA